MVRAGFEPALTVGACHPPITPLGLSRSPSGPTCSHHAAEPCMVGQFRVPCFLDIRFRAGNGPGWTRTSTFRLVASRLHSATGPNAALSPPVTHTLVGPTPLVRFARPSILEQDASTLIVSSHDPLTTGTNLSDANDAGRNRTGVFRRHAIAVLPLDDCINAADSPTAAPRPFLLRPCGLFATGSHRCRTGGFSVSGGTNEPDTSRETTIQPLRLPLRSLAAVAIR